MCTWRSFIKGAESSATLLIAFTAIGILAGSLNSTGLGLKFANVIVRFAAIVFFSAYGLPSWHGKVYYSFCVRILANNTDHRKISICSIHLDSAAHLLQYLFVLIRFVSL